MSVWRGLWIGALAACVVAGAAGCGTKAKRPQGPNPYRRDVDRADAPSASNGDASAKTTTQTAGPADPAVHTVGPPVLFVNQDVITIDDVLLSLRETLRQEGLSATSSADRPAVAILARREVDRQKKLAVVYNEARKALTEDMEKQVLKFVDAEIQQMVNLQFGGLHAKFEKYLADRGMSVADVREKVKRQQVALRYLKERFKDLAAYPKRDELHKFYEDHVADFTQPPTAKMSLIDIPFTAALKTPADLATEREKADAKKEARERIDRARQELDSGVAFDAVARAYSQGVKARNGGVWEEEIRPNVLRSRYDAVCEALFRLKAGERSGVIEGSDAYFIVRCDAITQARRLTFEEAQPRIANMMLDRRYMELEDRYVGELLSHAVIENQDRFVAAVIAAIESDAQRSARETASSSR